ncbi:hypothetical protein RFI_10664 [Reticulomyxa filosa]|uniref:Uncharacterized protein n=1 Tax=Reticulomyxa filosa TaxID=46433 RepID=X6NKG9_RETFI|nr:hypothetical protein RFI_10664 [Reticulomyxa filosa]|eukprot:ETO26476.1 hypothetical protein RFI_10664 [Reticulomyxa filosa]
MITLLITLALLQFKESLTAKEDVLLNLIQMIERDDVLGLREEIEKSPELIDVDLWKNDDESRKETKRPHTLLDVATLYGKVSIVEYLLEHQASGSAEDSMYWICVDPQDHNTWNTQPLPSVQNGFEDKAYSKKLLQAYLRYKANINDTSRHAEGMSLLTTCVLNGYIDVAELLLQSGVNVYAKDNYGLDVLDWLVKAPAVKFFFFF